MKSYVAIALASRVHGRILGFIGNGTAIKSVVFSSAFANTFDTNEANEIVNQLNADETRVWKYEVVPLY